MRRFYFGLFSFSLFIQGVVLRAEYSPLPAQVNANPVPLNQDSPSAAVGKAIYNPSVTNPAMGLVLDTVAGYTSNNQAQFDFRSAELNLSAPVDPFFNLYGVFNGTP